VLKRQPGITIDGAPGKPAIRMRGLGSGYVAILLNGLPAPGGFSLETIDPELVERIEILRAPTAETSGQAVAGAINIILRKAGKIGAPQTEMKAGTSFAAGRTSPSLTAQRSGRTGQLGYTLVASLTRKAGDLRRHRNEESRTRPLLRDTAWADRQIDDRLELAPRLDWQASSRDTVSSQSWCAGSASTTPRPSWKTRASARRRVSRMAPAPSAPIRRRRVMRTCPGPASWMGARASTPSCPAMRSRSMPISSTAAWTSPTPCSRPITSAPASLNVG
jgi:outer membrane receptor protein involved in Fe transport